MAANSNIRGYYIQSKMNNFVLDVKENKNEPGTPIIAFPMKTGANNDPSNQLWLLEEDGTIKSVATGMVLDIYGGCNGTDLVVWPKNNGPNQKWKWDESYIFCEDAGKVVDIEGKRNEPYAKIIAHPKNDGLNQQWHLVPKWK